MHVEGEMAITDSSEVQRLWARYLAKKDRATREKLILQYIPLVKYVVGRFPVSQSSILSFDDLLSHGIIGLVQAIERFDPSRGVKFETYAIQRIRGAVIDGIRSLNATGRAAYQRAREIEVALMKLDAQLGRTPTDEEVAAFLGIDVNTFRSYLNEVGIVTISLDGLLSFNEEFSEKALYHMQFEERDTANPETEAEKNEIRQRLKEALSGLDERDKLLLALYYHEELTMKEISEVLNISESRVCQLHTRAVLRLRRHLAAGTREGGEISAPRNLYIGFGNGRRVRATASLG